MLRTSATGQPPVAAIRLFRTMRLAAAAPHEFRPVLEMHGVVMIPAPTPDEPVPLEYPHDLHRDLVPEGDPAILAVHPIAPVVRPLQRDIDGNAMAMRRYPVGPGDHTTVIRAGRGHQENVESARQLVQLAAHRRERFGCSVAAVEGKALLTSLWQPSHARQIRLHLAPAAVAIDLVEEGFVACPPRIDVPGGRRNVIACGVGHGQHVLDVGIIEPSLEALRPPAVVQRHARAVPPDEFVAFDPAEVARISSEQTGALGIAECTRNGAMAMECHGNKSRDRRKKGLPEHGLSLFQLRSAEDSRLLRLTLYAPPITARLPISVIQKDA
ncbi:protein of unknown function [Hyphomicrobium sp. 1Nfss2.1]